MSSAAALQPKTERGITYICGGVGQEEVSYMKREAKNHDALLTFADNKGDYVADVNIALKDAKGNSLLETRCEAPMMLIDLPGGGKYRVHADVNGRVVERTLSVSKEPGKKAKPAAAVVMTWPVSVAEAEGPGDTATGASGTSGSGAAGKGSGNR
jgi:hypothetical protein